MESTLRSGAGDASSILAAASPFDHVLHAFVPKDHEIAARQAIYNAAALASLAALLLGAYAASAVLEPFLAPIFWAVLTGFLLHPHKARVSACAKSWLTSAASARRPILLSSALGLLRGLVLLCDGLGCYLLGLWRTLLAVAAVALSLLFLASANQNFVAIFYEVLSHVDSLSKTLSLLDSSQWFRTVLTVCLGTVSLAFFFPNAVGKRLVLLKGLSCFFWLSAVGYLLNNFISSASYLFLIPVAGYVVFATRRDVAATPGAATDRRTRKKSAPLAVFAATVLTTLVPKEMQTEVAEARRDNNKRPKIEVEDADVTDNVDDSAFLRAEGGSAATEETPARRPAKDIWQDRKRQLLLRNSGRPPNTGGGGSQYRSRRRARTRQQQSAEAEEEESPPPSSNAMLRVALTLCVILQFYLHPWLLHLLPAPFAVFALRRLWLTASLQPRFESMVTAVTEAATGGDRGDVLFPPPVRRVFNSVVGLECRVLRAASLYVDQMAAAAIILAGILMFTAASLFLSLELYAETLHITRGAGTLLVGVANSSTFQQLNSSLHDPIYQEGFEGIVESVHEYGRDFISSTVQTYLDDITNSIAASEMTEKLLVLWDRLYQYWLSRKKESVGMGPSVTDGALSSSFEDILSKLAEEEWKWDYIYSYCRENMGTLFGVAEQSWLVLKGNVGLLVTVLAEVLKLLLMSGSGVVNFGLSLIVYFTALFYLLSASDGSVYKPAELLGKHGKVLGEGFASTADRVVTGVFLLTFKMASFYGLWTYLTHTFFGVSVIVLPMLAAAFLAAVPFVGQYFAALPAALELWLAEGRPVQAALLLALHVLPSYVVDPLIYSEVRQGGMHPWLTALSVVGGIYYFGGASGAIYGPLVLCAVLVVLSYYPSLAEYVPAGGGGGGGGGGSVGSLESVAVSTPFVRRSESVC